MEPTSHTKQQEQQQLQQQKTTRYVEGNFHIRLAGDLSAQTLYTKHSAFSRIPRSLVSSEAKALEIPNMLGSNGVAPHFTNALSLLSTHSIMFHYFFPISATYPKQNAAGITPAYNSHYKWFSANVAPVLLQTSVPNKSYFLIKNYVF